MLFTTTPYTHWLRLSINTIQTCLYIFSDKFLECRIVPYGRHQLRKVISFFLTVHWPAKRAKLKIYLIKLSFESCLRKNEADIGKHCTMRSVNNNKSWIMNERACHWFWTLFLITTSLVRKRRSIFSFQIIELWTRIC